MNAGPSSANIDGDVPPPDVSMGLFHDTDGLPLKFHIQKHLGPIGDALRQQIEVHGGEVMKAVPINGYVLIDPDSEKGQALLEKWKDDTKPDRHIVCFTYVSMCIAMGEVVNVKEMKNASLLFTISGHPAEIYLHPSLGHQRRQNLVKDITKFGGAIAASANLAQVIVCDNTMPSFETLVKKYAHDNGVYVEPPEWVGTCIGRKRFEHDEVTPKAAGGRPTGSKRQEYTDEDDRNLVEYLGRRLPHKDMRGRTGNNIYKELCERADLYPWSENHTWSSWQNRYKKNQVRFDTLISAWVEKNPQPTMGKGQYVIAVNKTEARGKVAASEAADQSSLATDDAASKQKEKKRKDKDSKRPRKKRRIAKAPPASSDEDKNSEAETPSAEALMTKMITENS